MPTPLHSWGHPDFTVHLPQAQLKGLTFTWNLGGSCHHSVTYVFCRRAQLASFGWCQVLLSVPLNLGLPEPQPLQPWSVSLGLEGCGYPHSSVLRSTHPVKPLKQICMTAFPSSSGLADLVATPEAAFPGSRYKYRGFSVPFLRSTAPPCLTGPWHTLLFWPSCELAKAFHVAFYVI